VPPVIALVLCTLVRLALPAIVICPFERVSVTSHRRFARIGPRLLAHAAVVADDLRVGGVIEGVGDDELVTF
jgi:hypothetical protein